MALTPYQLRKLKMQRRIAERCLTVCQEEFRKVYWAHHWKSGASVATEKAAPAWSCVEAVDKIFQEFEQPIKRHEFPDLPK